MVTTAVVGSARTIVDNDAYLTRTQLVAYSGMSRRTLDGYMQRAVQPLPFYRVGGKVLVRRSEFDAWMRRFRHDDEQTDKLNNDINDILKGI